MLTFAGDPATMLKWVGVGILAFEAALLFWVFVVA